LWLLGFKVRTVAQGTLETKIPPKTVADPGGITVFGQGPPSVLAIEFSSLAEEKLIVKDETGVKTNETRE